MESGAEGDRMLGHEEAGMGTGSEDSSNFEVKKDGDDGCLCRRVVMCGLHDFARRV